MGKIKENELHAYVDGSYRSSDESLSYGIAYLSVDGISIDSKRFYNDQYKSMRNIVGECRGALAAMQYAIDNNYTDITIFYDYAGIEKWATCEWQAKNEFTKDYVAKYNEYTSKINITFEHVKAHSGNEYNEMADGLASNAE